MITGTKCKKFNKNKNNQNISKQGTYSELKRDDIFKIRVFCVKDLLRRKNPEMRNNSTGRIQMGMTTMCLEKS